jgi:cholesterol oxidase
MSDTTLQWSKNVDRWYTETGATPSKPPECDVLIIGSGYGGSFAARELAQTGVKVWVVERGREYALGEFPENIGTLPGHVHIKASPGASGIGNSDALFDMRRFDQVAMLVANGLGGGSLINAGVAIRPEPSRLDSAAWPGHYRQQGAGRTALWAAMGEVERQLQAEPLSDARDLKKFQALDTLAKSMGTEAYPAPLTIASADQISPAGVAQKACTRCGNCFTGCNVGAKNTLVTHVLPDAHQRGAEFITGATAVEVKPVSQGSGESSTGHRSRWIVRMVHTQGQHHEATHREFEIHAHTVIISAGALGSTEILLNSPEVHASALLGSRVSTNGDILALGWGMKAEVNGMAMPQSDVGKLQPTADRVGPTITGIAKACIDVANGGQRNVLFEDGAVPGALVHATVALGATLSLPHRYTSADGPGYFSQEWNVDRLATPPDMARHALLLLGMGPDDADGVASLVDVTAPNGDVSKALNVHWPNKGTGPDSPYYQALDTWLGDAKNKPDGGGFQGGDYLPNPLWRALPKDFTEITGGGNTAQGVSVHPLGGCPMGDSINTGVVDWRGTVFNRDGGVHEGLHVLDGAILPCAVGVNPFLTISALSLVAARDIATHLHTQAAANPSVPETRTRQQAVSASQLPSTDETVTLQFREHLQGYWKGAVPHWLAPLDTALTEIERQRAWIVSVDVGLDVARWLENPSMQLQGARMRVFRNPRPQDIAVHPDACKGTPELEGHGWVSLLALNAPQSQWDQWLRMLSALRTFLQRRGFSEFFELASQKSSAPNESQWAAGWRRLKGFYRAARNLSFYRELIYNFDLHSTERPQLEMLAHGRKRLAYAPDTKNVWDALVEIDLKLTPKRGGETATLCVTADLIDMVRNHRLQVSKAPHTPAGIVALASFAALWVRVLFQSHFWSFRGLNYAQLNPPKAAEHMPLNGDAQPLRVPLQVPRYRTGTSKEMLTLELTCYAPGSAHESGPGANQHLLLVHGLAHGGTVFTTQTTHGNNMAAAFHAEGYTVWVLDHRLSNRLPHHSNDHCMDDVAAIDIPAAVRHVYAEARQPIAVFAHCVGGGAFAMATLQGALNDPHTGMSMVSKAIIHAVHPWVVPSASNQLSGSLAALYKDFLPQNMAVNPVPPSGLGSALDQVLDRMGASLPWPAVEQSLHLQDQSDPQGGTATCNRMTLFYGREWVHANLNPATHRELASLVGPASVEVFRQLFFIINRQRLTDRDGANVYMTEANFSKHWTFPILFAHGSENKVFDPRSAVRSWGRLRQLQLPPSVRLLMAEGYGHMDFLFGDNAHRDVYPHLCAFLHDPNAFKSTWGADADASSIPSHWRDNDAKALRSLLVGPHIRFHEVKLGDVTQRALVLWAEFSNDPTRLHIPPTLQDSTGQHFDSWSTCNLAHVHLNPALDREVTLLNGPGSYWTGTLVEKSPGDFQRLGSLVLRRGDNGMLGEAQLAWQQLHWWQRWVELSTDEPVSWLAMSCRWPGTPFEGESIDAMSKAMLEHVTELHYPVDALIMLGDQIYADATANIFETRETDELLAGMYRDAWGTTHTQMLLSNVPSYTVVDDHEYGDNWSGSDNPLTDKAFINGFEAALAYQWRWNDDVVPRQHSRPEITQTCVTGFWSSFMVGTIPFFSADTRSERTLRTQEHWRSQAMVGAAQMAALKEWLLESGDKPKVLCSGSVFGFVERDLLHAHDQNRCFDADSWCGYPATWRELVAFIVAHQIKNLIFLSGDYHFSGIAELVLTADGGLPPVRAVSVVCSGWNASLPFINAQPRDFAMHVSAPYPHSDSAVSAQCHATPLSTAYRQFTKLTLTAQADNHWGLTARVYSSEGAELAKKSLVL